MKPTHIVRPVDPSSMLAEMVYFDQHCEQHSTQRIYELTGPLRHGRTVWLKGDRNLTFRQSVRENFDICIRFIEAIKEHFGYTDVGRSYVHRLQPGQSIDRHADVAEEYFYRVDRFQVYLNYPEGLEIVHQGEHGPNALIFFNKQAHHEYHNRSSEDWYLLVFDLEKK